MNQLIWRWLALASLAISFVALPTYASNTTISQNLSAGSLTLTAAASSTLSAATVNASSPQTSNGNLGSLSVTDSRGSGAGWSVTATATNFTRVGTPVRISGSAGGLSVAGPYNGTASGTYTVTITTGGVVGVAAFSVSGLETQGPTTTTAAPPLGTKGLMATFAAGTYNVGDQWTVSVDVIPSTGLTLTPSSVSTSGSDLTGVSAGAAHTFTSTGDSATIMTASSGNGLGQYTDNPLLSLVIPAASHSGSYSATIYETVN